MFAVLEAQVFSLETKKSCSSAKKTEKNMLCPVDMLGFGETSADAVIREFREETSIEVICKRLLWTEECFWKSNEKDIHSVVTYYELMAAQDLSALMCGEFVPQNDNPKVLFGFVDISKIKEMKVYPSFLSEKIISPNDNSEHFITRE